MNKWLLFVAMLLAGSVGFAEEPVAENSMAEETAVAVESESAVTDATSAADVETTIAQPASAYLPVALVAFGDVDDALVSRARAWAERNLAISVPVLDAQPLAQYATFDEVAQHAEAMMEANRLGLVVIWRPKSDINNHGVSYPEKRIAIANLNPMFTEGTDPEIIERRVERQVIRGICHVVGLEPSPNPLSAMFSYSNLQELDGIGRNLDLPWLQKLQERMVEKGIPLEPESPFNVLR